MNRLVLAVLFAMLVSTPVMAGTPDFAGLQLQHFDPPKPTPAFAFPDLSGKVVKLDDLRGKVTMLLFWATW